jgi:hypothetical protein
MNAVGLSPGQISGASSSAQQFDSGQLSPVTQLLSTLQQLQESNPTEYQQVTQQISSNLAAAAQTATSQGNTSAATELTQLSTDFSQASQNNQLPSIQDLANAIGGGHHHHGHHHFQASSGSSTSTSATTDSSTSSSSSANNSPVNQILSLFQSGAAQNDALNPLSIIDNTLTSAGIIGN